MVDDHKYEGRCLGALSQTTPYTLSLKFLHGDPKLTRAQAHSIGLTTDKAIQLVVQHGARGLEKYVCPVIKEYRTHVLQSVLTASRQKSPSAAATVSQRFSQRSVQFAVSIAQGDAWWVQEMGGNPNEQEQVPQQQHSNTSPQQNPSSSPLKHVAEEEEEEETLDETETTASNPPEEDDLISQTVLNHDLLRIPQPENVVPVAAS